MLHHPPLPDHPRRAALPAPRPAHRPAGRPGPLAATVLLGVLAVLLTACGGAVLPPGTPGPYDRPETDRITGEVERVEAYADEIDLWTADRRIVTVRYDDDTTVTYRGDLYDPTDLERGDLVMVDVRRTSTGTWLAERIEVEEARQDRVGGDDPYDDPYAEDDRRTVDGEVRAVDLEARRIEIATEDGRRTLTYGRATPVYFRGQEYEVTGLEPGDVIRADVDVSREPWRVVDFITVTLARQERDPGDGPLYGDPDDGDWQDDDAWEDDEPWDDDSRSDDSRSDGPAADAGGERFAGTVQEVDERRGEFVLATERYGLKTVVMPYAADRDARATFDRLRRGDTVRLEGVRIEGDRIELLHFGWGDER